MRDIDKHKRYLVDGRRLKDAMGAVHYLREIADYLGRNKDHAVALEKLINTAREQSSKGKGFWISIPFSSQERAELYFPRIEGISHTEDVVSIVDRDTVRVETDFPEQFVNGWFQEMGEDRVVTVQGNPHA